MAAPRELSPAECVELLTPGGVGRAAVCSSTGPEIFPVNFVVDGDSIVFRTSAYSALGTLAPGGDVAFEVDYLDNEMRQGWSVVATGRAKAIEEPAEIEMLRERGLEPSPWASGLRRLYIRLEWRDITGRAVGDT